MPLLIPRADCERWLDPSADVADLLTPGETNLVATPVSDYVNSPVHDDPKCIERAEAPADDALLNSARRQPPTPAPSSGSRSFYASPPTPLPLR